MRRRFSKDPVVVRSLDHSIKDGVAYSVMTGGGESYLSAFALFLKASTEQIGLLASLPPLLGSFAQLLSAWCGRLTGRRKTIMLTGALLQGFSWFPLALLPLFFPEYAVYILIACVVIYYAGANLALPQWSSLMGELVPEKRRGRFFALRTRLASITSFITLVCAGVILSICSDNQLTRTGFLVIFGIAAVARFVSVYHLFRMHDQAGHIAVLELPVGQAWWLRIRHSRFVHFSVYFTLMMFSVAIASPFFAVYLLRDLGFSYLEYMVCTASTVLMQFLTLNMWGRVSDMYGNRLILAVTGFIIPFSPLLWLVSSNFWYLIVIQAFGGLLWAGFSLSAGNYLYDIVPAKKRVTYLSIHNVLFSIGIFFGAMLGGYIGATDALHDVVGKYRQEWPSVLYGVFIISSSARFLVAILFLPWMKEVRQVKPASIGLIYRVIRFNPVSGFIFDVVGALQPQKSRSSARHKDD